MNHFVGLVFCPLDKLKNYKLTKYSNYTIGGHWDGFLPTIYGDCVNNIEISKIVWSKVRVPKCFVDSGGYWYESGLKYSYRYWDNFFNQYIKDIKDLYPNLIIYVIDFIK